jgi:hypothetical protein
MSSSDGLIKFNEINTQYIDYNHQIISFIINLPAFEKLPNFKFINFRKLNFKQKLYLMIRAFVICLLVINCVSLDI